MESATPRALSGKFKEDFAYCTIKDRLPVILSRVADTVYRMRPEVDKTHGEAGVEDLKVIVSYISKLRNEMQTDKPITRLGDSRSDTSCWNTFIEAEAAASGAPMSWFSSPWLHVECYMYRRVQEAVEHSSCLRHLDPFQQQKQEAFTDSMKAMAALATHLAEMKSRLESHGEAIVASIFHAYTRVALWGNKCDLSISAGQTNSQNCDAVSQLAILERNILIDNTSQVLDVLEKARETSPGNVRLDVVLDNAGFEVFTDLVYVDFLLTAGLVHKVVFHGKAMPWFVSDVTKEDFDWTLKQLAGSSHEELKELGCRWQRFMESGTWTLQTHDFWTMPFAYNRMKEVAPELYSELSNASLVIFKGDLNYRKLVRDLRWEMSTSFAQALGGFQPAPLVALRTLKADVVVGLEPEPGVTEDMVGIRNWMVLGEYAVIQASVGQQG